MQCYECGAEIVPGDLLRWPKKVAEITASGYSSVGVDNFAGEVERMVPVCERCYDELDREKRQADAENARYLKKVLLIGSIILIGGALLLGVAVSLATFLYYHSRF